MAINSDRMVFVIGIFFSIILPRLFMLGSYPFLDEGFYLYESQLIWQQIALYGKLPDFGGFWLYPLLVSPIFSIQCNVFILVRLIDLIFASVMGYIFIKIMIRESDSTKIGILLGSLSLFCMNLPDIIQGGFKNSFFIAYIPLLYAFYHVQCKKTNVNYFVIGCLVALSVLLRETFIIYALIGFIVLFFFKNYKDGLFYCAGGILTFIVVFAIIGYYREGYVKLIQSYISAGAIFSAEANRIWYNFFHYGQKAILYFGPVILTMFISAFYIIRHGNRNDLLKLIFWVAVSLLSIAEVIFKIGYLYHFSMLIPCFCAISSLGFKIICKNKKFVLSGLKRFIVILFIAMYSFHFSISQINMTVDMLRSFPKLYWGEDYIEESNPLLTVKSINQFSESGGTLAVNGFMYVLYPLTGMLSPIAEISDLSRCYILNSMSNDKLKDIIRTDPPNIIVIFETKEKDHVAMFTDELNKVVENLHIYDYVGSVPIDENKNYGWLGCKIYKKNESK